MKLDLGCGPNKKGGFHGVDWRKFEGVDTVLDLTKRWPWKSGSVEEAHSSHFIEHLDSRQRCHFWNELHRVLKPGAQATIIAPFWRSGRAYGDPTHVWPPISEMAFFYLDRTWRAANAPHCEGMLQCDFTATWGYNLHPSLSVRNQDWQSFAVSYYAEAIQDVVVTLTKR